MSGSAGSTMERPAAPIDPRIRARRIEVRRTEGRRRLRRAMWLVVVAALVAGAWGMTRTALLDVDRGVVAGAAHTGRDAVVEAARVRHGDPLLDVDAARVRADVERLPWVAAATVSRSWPGTVHVRIRERTPVALAPAGDGWALVDGGGRVLERVAEAPDGVPVLAGVRPAGEPGSTLRDDAAGPLAVAAALPGRLEPRVRAITLDGRQLVLSVGEVPNPDDPDPRTVPVRFGPATDVAAKLVALDALLTEVGDLGAVAQIDVRVPSAPTLTHVA